VQVTAETKTAVDRRVMAALAVASALEGLLDVDESGGEHPAPAALSVVS
jgi:hypothetical protein